MKINKGFTLLELLIVIAILAVLGAIVVFVLNPVETLKKTRDSQRISDLPTIKTALGLFVISTSTPQLDGISGTKNALCKVGSGQDTIWYSSVSASTTASGFVATSSANAGYTNGTGWIPANLDALTGGSPISNFPVDPINTLASTAATSSDLVYRYTCESNASNNLKGFEINARLESDEYTDKMTTDGGDNSNLYEVGTKIRDVLPAGGTPF